MIFLIPSVPKFDLELAGNAFWTSFYLWVKQRRSWQDPWRRRRTDGRTVWASQGRNGTGHSGAEPYNRRGLKGPTKQVILGLHQTLRKGLNETGNGHLAKLLMPKFAVRRKNNKKKKKEGILKGRITRRKWSRSWGLLNKCSYYMLRHGLLLLPLVYFPIAHIFPHLPE